jgi:hypothetical protein
MLEQISLFILKILQNSLFINLHLPPSYLLLDFLSIDELSKLWAEHAINKVLGIAWLILYELEFVVRRLIVHFAYACELLLQE